MRLRLLAVFAFVCVYAPPLSAQTVDRDAILATVQKVFDAMRTRDTSL
jgi:hypothetical protein